MQDDIFKYLRIPFGFNYGRSCYATDGWCYVGFRALVAFFQFAFFWGLIELFSFAGENSFIGPAEQAREMTFYGYIVITVFVSSVSLVFWALANYLTFVTVYAGAWLFNKLFIRD